MDGSTFTATEQAFMPFTPLPTGHGALSRARKGIATGTLLATSTGWRAVQDLAPGDKVQTFDNGMQPIVDISCETFWSGGQASLYDPIPVVIRAGALNNHDDITVLPHQGILLESENACDAMGDPLAVVPARVLVGINGIEAVPPQRALTVYTLTFAGEEVVYADGGLMLHCPASALPDDMQAAPALYDVKSLVQARRMLTDLDVAQLVLDEAALDEFVSDTLERVA